MSGRHLPGWTHCELCPVQGLPPRGADPQGPWQVHPKTKMGNMGRPRKFFVAGDDGDTFVFWTLNVDQDKQATMEPNYDEMMAWGITKEMADSIAGEAVNNAMGRRQ